MTASRDDRSDEMARKKVVSIRLAEEQAQYLARLSRRLGRTPSQTAAMLVDEGLRRERFPLIEMRETAAGRTAYIKRSRFAVHLVRYLVEEAGERPEELAADRGLPLQGVLAALDYARAFPEEIEAADRWEADFEENPEKFIPGILVYRPGEATS
jgi:uncharacterized protein (DUF433 family)